MNQEARNNLIAAIDKMIFAYSQKASSNRRYALITHIVTASLAALTTITIAINTNSPSNFVNIVALILSTLVTFNHTLNSFFNNKDFWIEFNEKANELRKLKFDINIEEAANITLSPEKFAEFKSRYQTIVDSMNSFWRLGRSKSTDELAQVNS